MTTRDDLLESLAGAIADYREGQVPPRTPPVIDEWLRQFPLPAQLPILRELDHVFRRTYFSRAKVEARLRDLATMEVQAGINPKDFWPSAHLLNIQRGGQSQRDITAMFSQIFRDEHGFDLQPPADASTFVYDATTFVYMDDFSGTGGRLRSDLEPWIEDAAPSTADLHIVLMVRHKRGTNYNRERLQDAIRESGKSITITWWPSVQIEDRREHLADSEILWPSEIPNDEMVHHFVSSLRYHPILREGIPSGPNRVFSSEEGRHVLEQQLLVRGEHIRLANLNLRGFQRPLGNTVLETVGPGSMVVFFRNCPNTTPLALWASDPPLFPRRPN